MQDEMYGDMLWSKTLLLTPRYSATSILDVHCLLRSHLKRLKAFWLEANGGT